MTILVINHKKTYRKPEKTKLLQILKISQIQKKWKTKERGHTEQKSVFIIYKSHKKKERLNIKKTQKEIKKM